MGTGICSFQTPSQTPNFPPNYKDYIHHESPTHCHISYQEMALLPHVPTELFGGKVINLASSWTSCRKLSSESRKTLDKVPSLTLTLGF